MVPHNAYLIDKVESVQKRFTNKLSCLMHLTYPERLCCLEADSLETRRLKMDITMYFRILHNFVDVDCSNLFLLSASTNTRGHSFKLDRPICKSNLQLNQFAYRGVNAWNSLPNNCVTVTSVHSFKVSLRSVNLSRFCKYHS